MGLPQRRRSTKRALSAAPGATYAAEASRYPTQIRDEGEQQEQRVRLDVGQGEVPLEVIERKAREAALRRLSVERSPSPTGPVGRRLAADRWAYLRP